MGNVIVRLLGKATVLRDFLREHDPNGDNAVEDGLVVKLVRIHEGRAVAGETEAGLLELERILDRTLKRMQRIEEIEWNKRKLPDRMPLFPWLP